MFVRPGGTIEGVPWNAAFERPYGTRITIITHLPSSELLGYCHVSLRDKNVGKGNRLCPGMKLPMDRLQPRQIDVRIELRGGDAGVA